MKSISLLLSLSLVAALAAKADPPPARGGGLEPGVRTEAGAGAGAGTARELAFDPGRKPLQDLEQAKAEARQSGRRILVLVGGSWSPSSRKLAALWDTDKELRALRAANFVLLRVSHDNANRNSRFLELFPWVQSFPHLFVLDAAGRLLHSQPAAPLGEGREFRRERLIAFLNQWKP